MPTRLDEVIQYHHMSKHAFERYAPGPRGLDWATQPDPFRRYHGAPALPLHLVSRDGDAGSDCGSVGYDRALAPARLEMAGLEPQPVEARTLSQLFQDGVALSAWKSHQGASWALRVNPSSGNLHPTETYLIGGPFDGLTDRAVVAHYAPRDHLLEVRAEIPALEWDASRGRAPDLLLAFSSLHWREAWKYGERAFRYCQHDVGHAVAALAVAAAGLGWRLRLIDTATTRQIEDLLGLGPQRERLDREGADCLLGVYASSPGPGAVQPRLIAGEAASVTWLGDPSDASPEYVEWDWVRRMAGLTEKEAEGSPHSVAGPSAADDGAAPAPPAGVRDESLAARPTGHAQSGHRQSGHRQSGPPRAADPKLHRIAHQRRSAVDMDPAGHVSAEGFYRLLAGLEPASGRIPLDVLGWEPLVHLVLFVHRVDDVPPGLYLMVRNAADEADLRQGLNPEFEWEAVDSGAWSLPL